MKLPVMLGPTAVGKTELSIRVCSELGAEVVSADSRQVYRLMNIGTAKPTAKELSSVRHHMIDIVDPNQRFGAGQYGSMAREVVNGVSSVGTTPVVVGGSGLYIRALVEGFFDAPAVDESLRKSILNQAERKGTEYLHERLREVDPDSARRIHPNDLQRISRALEVFEQTGRPISFLQDGKKRGDIKPLYIGLNRDRTDLLARIDERVDRMISDGFPDEVSELLRAGYSAQLNSFRAVGYREMADCVTGKIGLREAVSLTKKRTKAFARRQLTWFRNLAGVEWINLSSSTNDGALGLVSSLIQTGLSGS